MQIWNHMRTCWKRPAVLWLLCLFLASCQAGSSAQADLKPSPSMRGALGTPKSYAKPSEQDMKTRLTQLQYDVTQKGATERAFSNAYWDNKAPGLYVDVVTGEPLFSSTDKFDSGTGWPSFTQPIEPGRVKQKTDYSLGMPREEVVSAEGKSHLGHVFPDGPGPSGMRFCINSASLRFIPVEQLEQEGYGEYAPLFGVSSAGRGAASDTSTETHAASSGGGVAQPNKSASGTPAVPCAPGSSDPACAPRTATAVLAGGCFWGMEDLLRKIPGVLETQVGYAGGFTANPTYATVKDGTTGHAESVQVVFDPSRISYAELLEKWFFRMHDPTTRNRQGNDMGSQYRSAIFVSSPEQRRVAQEAISKIDASKKWSRPIVTTIEEAGVFTPAEDYHQDYLEKHPGGYTCHYLRPW